MQENNESAGFLCMQKGPAVCADIKSFGKLFAL